MSHNKHNIKRNTSYMGDHMLYKMLHLETTKLQTKISDSYLNFHQTGYLLLKVHSVGKVPMHLPYST